MLLRSLFLLAMFLAQCNVQAADKASVAQRAWDRLLPSDLFSDVSNFDRTIEQEGNERIFVYTAKADDGSPLMSVVVAVGPVGGRLDPGDWESAAAAATASERARDFPEVGARAQTQAPSISPEGAFSGVVFATSDQLFDVLVSVYEASSAAPRGTLTATDAARRVEKAYDDSFE